MVSLSYHLKGDTEYRVPELPSKGDTEYRVPRTTAADFPGEKGIAR
jgi:hypothetical protein